MALRQHRFAWLQGDPDPRGRTRDLPVDAYYPDHYLVVEYRERQHDLPVPHFDKPDVVTLSGVPRGQQRRIYDRRREVEIPAHGLRLVIIKPSDLSANGSGRLRQDRAADLPVVKTLLQPNC